MYKKKSQEVERVLWTWISAKISADLPSPPSRKAFLPDTNISLPTYLERDALIL